MCRQYLNGRKISFLLIEETEENEPSKGAFIVKKYGNEMNAWFTQPVNFFRLKKLCR